MRSLGLVIKVLIRFRSIYREKESGVGSFEKEEKRRVLGEGVGVCFRFFRLGRFKVVSK